MTREVCILDRGYKSYSYEERLFRELGYDLKIYGGSKDNHDDKIRFARNAEGIFVRWTIISDRELAKMPGLKVIIRYGTGYDNIDIEDCRKAGVKVANVSGYGNHSVSNHALALMFACTRDLISGTREFKTIFGKAPDPNLPDFHEMTLGIVGLGRIGSTLASKARYLFRNILAADPYIDDDKFTRFGTEKSDFDTLLKSSDVISIHCNLTEETRHMFNRQAFSEMKDHLILVNTARGPVIQTEALLETLDKGRLFRVGLDVFDSDIPEEIPSSLTSHPRVIATGHYEWYSHLSHLELQKRATDNMIGLLKGEYIEDCLTD